MLPRAWFGKALAVAGGMSAEAEEKWKNVRNISLPFPGRITPA
jgi:hypothetical protein